MKTPLIAVVLATILPATAPAALVAHWTLDSDASDATGNGYDGAVVGSAVTFGQPPAPGLSGSSADFSGNGHIDVPWSAALNPGTQTPDGSGSFTVTLWAFPTAVGGGHRSPFTAREDNGTTVNGPIIYSAPVDANNSQWQYWAGNNGPTGQWNNLNDGAVIGNTWTHVAITYDAATTTRTMYIDGTEAVTANLGVSANLLRDLHIGSGQDDGLNFNWVGRIDDVGFWDTALSQSQIQNVMTNGVPEPALPALLGLAGSLWLARRRR